MTIERDEAADIAAGCGIWTFILLAVLGLGFYLGYQTALGAL